jgi:hypothetical protein
MTIIVIRWTLAVQWPMFLLYIPDRSGLLSDHTPGTWRQASMFFPVCPSNCNYCRSRSLPSTSLPIVYLLTPRPFDTTRQFVHCRWRRRLPQPTSVHPTAQQTGRRPTASLLLLQQGQAFWELLSQSGSCR